MRRLLLVLGILVGTILISSLGIGYVFAEEGYHWYYDLNDPTKIPMYLSDNDPRIPELVLCPQQPEPWEEGTWCYDMNNLISPPVWVPAGSITIPELIPCKPSTPNQEKPKAQEWDVYIGTVKDLGDGWFALITPEGEEILITGVDLKAYVGQTIELKIESGKYGIAMGIDPKTGKVIKSINVAGAKVEIEGEIRPLCASFKTGEIRVIEKENGEKEVYLVTKPGTRSEGWYKINVNSPEQLESLIALEGSIITLWGQVTEYGEQSWSGGEINVFYYSGLIGYEGVYQKAAMIVLSGKEAPEIARELIESNIMGLEGGLHMVAYALFTLQNIAPEKAADILRWLGEFEGGQHYVAGIEEILKNEIPGQIPLGHKMKTSEILPIENPSYSTPAEEPYETTTIITPKGKIRTRVPIVGEMSSSYNGQSSIPMKD